MSDYTVDDTTLALTFRYRTVMRPFVDANRVVGGSAKEEQLVIKWKTRSGVDPAPRIAVSLRFRLGKANVPVTVPVVDAANAIAPRRGRYVIPKPLLDRAARRAAVAINNKKSGYGADMEIGTFKSAEVLIRPVAPGRDVQEVPATNTITLVFEPT